MNKYKLNDYIVQPNKIAKRMIYKDEKVAAFILSIAEGATLPPHTHFDCTVLIQVLKGSARAKIDGNLYDISENELIELQGKEMVSVENTSAGTLNLYVTLSPNPPSDQYTTDIDI